jgi:hypothetical protein
MKSDAELQHEVDDETMEDVRNFDYEAVQLLFSVIEKQASVVPKATVISGLAAVAINRLNDEAKEIAQKRADLFNAKVAERQIEENERIQAIKDEEADKARAYTEARMRYEAEKAMTNKVPLTTEKDSPRAAPQPTLTENARRV